MSGLKIPPKLIVMSGLLSLLLLLSRTDSFQLHQSSFLQSRYATCPFVLHSSIADLGSDGVQSVMEYLNCENANILIKKLSLLNKKLKDDIDKENMWTGGNFVIKSSKCIGIVESGLKINVECNIKGNTQFREILVPFPDPVGDETMLKNVLITMALQVDRIIDTAAIVSLPFGLDAKLPSDFRFNDVPHASWVRSYVYDMAASALSRAMSSDSKCVPNKSRMQMRINIPEMNPAFDTYRIGTILEMIRAMVLPHVYEGKKVRICVQQSLGEGVFSGMPLALSSMRPVLERMDWCGKQKDTATGEEPDVRFGTIGEDQISNDDDMVILIAPQNVVGGSLMDPLEQMIKEAERRSVPVVLVNPLLEDRPSSNNLMQIRGRAERRTLADSFQEIFCMRLLYPSTGGYMYPIRGMLLRRDATSPYVAYSQSIENGRENYIPKGAFPPGDRNAPDPSLVSALFTTNR